MRGKIAYLHRVQGRPDELSDEALIAACGQGDRAALGALFDRHHRAVYRFLARLSGTDERDLDDLVQATFVEVLRSAGRFKGRSAGRTWVLGVAHNVVRHHVRSEVRRKRMVAAAGELPTPDGGNPDEEVGRREQLALLGGALAELPAGLRVVFVMCDLEQVPGVEAARVLGLRPGTVWRRLHEARKALAQAIERRPA
jgi:RNA polymerase sigma-70 factor (ECF subfamily)